MAIAIIPDNSVALPDSAKDQEPESAREAIEVSATTSVVMQELGLPFDMTPEDEKKAHELFDKLRNDPKNKNLPAQLNTPEVAAKVGALLQHYDHQVVADAIQLRTVITNKLVLLADCGDPRYELKALEMLGKISDVGLFTDKSEVTIIHKSTDELEQAIRDKVRRLIHSTTIDVEPLVDDLEAELGVKDDAEPDSAGTTDTSENTAQSS